MPITKHCLQCGLEFSCPPSQFERRTCCSMKCYHKWRQGKAFSELRTLRCFNCGKQYESRGALSEYCSPACREAARGDRGVETQCQQCGNSFRHRADQVRKYCSHACRAKAKAESSICDLICDACGKLFRGKRRYVAKGRSGRKYCSRECSLVGMSRIKDKGGHVNKAGYRVVRRNGESVLEHRHLVEQRLGRRLLDHETVHHKNGDRGDNSEQNLEVWIKRPHAGQRPEDLIPWMIEILTAYGYTVEHATRPQDLAPDWPVARK